ncbi:MAG: CPBP family intramembrane glutamic endopeptidase [Novosphingobium sp.]
MQSTKARTPLNLLLIAALAFAAIQVAVKTLPHLTEASDGLVVVRELVLLVGSIALVVWLAKAGTVGLAAMGCKRPTWKTLGWGLLCALVSVIVSGLMIFAMMRTGITQNASVLGALAIKPVWLLLLISLTAAVSEEIVFRGVILSHVASATGRVWLGALVSLALFAAAHLSGWGWSQVLFAAVPGAVLTLFFVWKRDLGVVMIGHFLTDALGLLSAAAQAHNL